MMLYRSAPKFSWNTHYVGHLRGINNEFIDSYQLKSLDTLIQLNDADNHWPETLSKRADGKLTYAGIENRIGGVFDIVISAIGWQFNKGPFAELTPRMMDHSDGGDRYPELDATYQSVNIPGLYFAGGLSHGPDKGKSSGGFIHGFRYNVRALAKILLSECKHGNCMEWPSEEIGCISDHSRKDFAAAKMAKNMMERIGSTSGLYQMFGELQDMYVFQNGCLHRYEEVPKRYVETLKSKVAESDASVFTVTLRYREGFSEPLRDVFDPSRVVIPRLPAEMVQGGLAYEHLSNGWFELNFLHPVLESLQYGSSSSCTELLNSPFHLMEDIRTLWNRPLDFVPLVEWLLVRVVGNPCDFGKEDELKKQLTTYWQIFMMEASKSGSEPSDGRPMRERVPQVSSSRKDL